MEFSCPSSSTCISECGTPGYACYTTFNIKGSFLIVQLGLDLKLNTITLGNIEVDLKVELRF